MKILFLYWLFVSPPADTLKLEECYQKAMEQFPLSKQIKLYDNILELRLSNLNAKYLPEPILNAQTSYQSDVSVFPISLPSVTIPVQHKDAYQVSLVTNQLVYDFGLISNQKGVEKAQTALDKKSVEVELYKLKTQVNEAFFSVLLLQEKERSLRLTDEDVRTKLTSIRSKVKNGTILPSNADILESELLKIAQTVAETKANKMAAIDVLSQLLDLPLEEPLTLAIPYDVTAGGSILTLKRPEFAAFDLSRKKIDRSIELTGRRNLPKISAFLQLSYARPGINAFDNTFQKYYIAGLRASWTFWNWNTDSRDKEILKQQQLIISTQEEAFTKNISIAAQKNLSEIDKLQELIKLDRDIIALRKKVTQQLSSQLDNGVVTSSEYLTELNAEHQASLTLESHKIQLIKAQKDYLITIGE
ncbi:TolC family protein [bacterium]|nr:TolC family protein [bacterium]